MSISDEDLLKLLVNNQLATNEQLQSAQELSRLENVPLYEAIIRKDIIPDEHLGLLIADFLEVPFIFLSKVSIPHEVLSIIPVELAKKQKIIAFAKDADGLKLAMNNPSNKEEISIIEKKIGASVTPFFATERDINQALSLYEQELQTTFDGLLQQEVDAAGKTTATEAPISRIVDLIIRHAYSNKASDIHIEPEKKDSLVRYRIDGVLHDVVHLPNTIHEQLITRIKVLSKLRTDEHLSAQDGKLQLHLESEDLDIRVSVVPIVEGEKVVMRLLSSRSRQFSLNDLGMNEKDLSMVNSGFAKPFGMVLSTGPTGSGKTTSIYSILKIINTREKNIATIEDPVEYEIEGINQIQVNPKTNLTFAAGLRSILRQDPDIIFVGEIRDGETANIAINSAMTGHLVLSTLHTNDAATTLPRLIDMGIEPFLVATTVNIIIGQRLIRKICQKCRESTTLTREELTKQISPDLVNKHFGDRAEIRVYRGIGCPLCHSTGYRGRIGIFEVLQITEDIRKLITEKADSDLIRKKAVEDGMTTMLEDGLDKALQGITTIEEVLRATKE